ncbi:TIM-barrel domain-containing protein [Spirochaetia bacterium 38H-sp]|uniref:TIM-barrel domain-containing protein n=1 Tax=Rarispira pelagica TaxID=3141764 RepID=A0ABU9U9A6_9SPIR
MYRIESGRVIVGNKVRLSCLCTGLIRIQYAKSGVFEDRQSVRAIGGRGSVGFDSVEEIPGGIRLQSGDFYLHYMFCDMDEWERALSAYHNDKLVWQPDMIDSDNLGGVHLGMDCIQRGIIPEGVHSADKNYHPNSTEYHLWNYVFAEEGTQPDAHYYGGLVTIEQLLAREKLETLVPQVRKIIEERKKYPPSFLSRSGYFLYNDSCTAVYDDSGWPVERKACETDWYLFLYGRDYSLAYRQYLCLFGRSEMLPRYVLGLWFSRFPTYRREKIAELYECFSSLGVPLDVFVFDLEWHKGGWYGFDWDEERYPCYRALIASLKEKGVRLAVNIHPDGLPVSDSLFADFVKRAGIEDSYREKVVKGVFKPVDLSSKAEAEAFFDVFHKPLMDEAIDIMWIDGHASANIEGLDKQLWTNELYWRFLKNQRQNARPVILSRTEGFGSHRYPVHFTGDTYSQFEVLRSQVEYTLRAGHMAQSMVSHDIGGHMWRYKHLNPELLCRWYQFGAMSPIFRLHSSGGSERVPWEYDEFVERSFRQAMLWRYSLLPYFYTLMRESHDTGLPLCRSFSLFYPNWEDGLSVWDEYMLGDRILCTPFVRESSYRSVILPEGEWFYPVSGERYIGDGKSSFVLLGEADFTPPHFIKTGSILIKQSSALSASSLPRELVIELYPASLINDSISVYEDDGVSMEYSAGKFCYTNFSAKGDSRRVEISISYLGDVSVIPEGRSFSMRVFCDNGFKLLADDRVMFSYKKKDEDLYPVQRYYECKVPYGTKKFSIVFV